MQKGLIEASLHPDWQNRVENWDNFAADRAHTQRVLAAEKTCKSKWTDAEKAGVSVKVEYDAEEEAAYIAASNKQAAESMAALLQQRLEASAKAAARKKLMRRRIIAVSCLILAALSIVILMNF